MLPGRPSRKRSARRAFVIFQATSSKPRRELNHEKPTCRVFNGTGASSASDTWTCLREAELGLLLAQCTVQDRVHLHRGLALYAA
jgi:hypothetical protein